MNLFDVLSNDDRVIVLSDHEYGCIYTWNFSLTLSEWRLTTNAHIPEFDDIWEEVEVRTLSEKPKSFEAAKEAAKNFRNRVGGNYDPNY